MAPALTSKALERDRVSPVGCAFLSIFYPLADLSLVSTWCRPCAMAGRCAMGCDSLSKTGLVIMRAGVARSTSLHPSPPTASLGLFGVLARLLPCPTLVRVAINFTIWYPNSIVPSPGSVVMAALALTLSQASSLSLSALWMVPSTENKLSQGYSKRTLFNLWCPCGLHGRDSLRCCWTSRSVTLPWHCNIIWLRVPSSHVVKEGTFSCLPCITF